jgi:hypothetical protein
MHHVRKVHSLMQVLIYDACSILLFLIALLEYVGSSTCSGDISHIFVDRNSAQLEGGA